MPSARVPRRARAFLVERVAFPSSASRSSLSALHSSSQSSSNLPRRAHALLERIVFLVEHVAFLVEHVAFPVERVAFLIGHVTTPSLSARPDSLSGNRGGAQVRQSFLLRERDSRHPLEEIRPKFGRDVRIADKRARMPDR
jgi:hypothetical protein